VRAIDVPCLCTSTLMTDDEDKRRLAAEVLAFARRIGALRSRSRPL
jgi:hypothetical protein